MSSSTSSIIESQILHTTTTRTLHAHNFNKSSTQATHTLTDALSRYLALLAETCAHYAQHAGRTGVTVHDALAALEDVGIGIDELREYVQGEAKEMLRYTGQTTRRADELAEIKAAVSEGLKQDHSDAMQLVYASIPDVDVSWPSEDEDQLHVDLDVGLDQHMGSAQAKNIEVNFDAPRSLEPYPDLSSPHLPPSPVSPPHARKRARTSNWKPPEHIPDFLPPFPGHVMSPSPSPLHETSILHAEPTSSSNEDKTTHSVAPVSIPSASTTPTTLKPYSKSESQLEPQPIVRPPSPPLPASSTTSSSYLTSVPYEHSSLSSVPEWHLPRPPPHLSPPAVSSTLPALLSSYSYLQSSSLSAPSLQPPNPLRHGLAMMLLGVSSRAYSPAATLFASSNTNTCTPVPHRAAPLAAHAVVLDKNGKANFSIGTQKGTLPVPPPEWHARSVASPVAIVDSTTVQGSRIPILARTMLSPPVIARATRLIPPLPLARNDQKLLYGQPLPAPWNTVNAEGKGFKGGKDNDDDEEEEDRVLSDAHLFATWDYDPKDFRASLPMARRGTKMGLGFGGANGTLPTMKRKRSDSVAISRRSEAGPAMTRIKTER